MAKLMPGYKINLLRDLRKETLEKWLSNQGYINFLRYWPDLEKKVRDNESTIVEALGISADEFLSQLSTDRPAYNFNPRNRLGKPRPKWSPSEITELRSVSGL